jgi:ketosteroid isomerase-like protein
MTNDDNKKLVMKGYQLFKTGDIGALLELYHNDAEWIGPESEFVPFAGAFHGKPEIGLFFSKLNASLQYTRFEPNRFLAEDEVVVVMGTSSFIAKPTGRSMDSAWVHVFSMRDGKVARFQNFYDSAAMERAFHPDLGSQESLGTRLHH